MILDCYVQSFAMDVGFLIVLFTMLRIKERFRHLLVPFLLVYYLPDIWLIYQANVLAVQNEVLWIISKAIISLATLLWFVVFFEGGVWKIAVAVVICDILGGFPQTILTRFSEGNSLKLEFILAPDLPYIPVGVLAGVLIFLCIYFPLRKVMLKFAASDIDKNFWVRLFGGIYWLNTLSQIITPWSLLWHETEFRTFFVVSEGMVLVAMLMIFYWTHRQVVFSERYYLRRQAELMQEYYRTLQEQVGFMQQWEQEIQSAAYGYLEKAGGFDKEKDGIFAEKALPDYTKSVVVNQVLAGKEERCRKEGISFAVEALEFAPGAVEEKDFVILLFNILDNAIEECEKLEDTKERRIYLHMQGDSQGVWVTCENTAKKEKAKRLGLITRKEGSYHGSGMGIIRDLVKKYGGQLSYERKEESFFLEISGLRKRTLESRKENGEMR